MKVLVLLLVTFELVITLALATKEFDDKIATLSETLDAKLKQVPENGHAYNLILNARKLVGTVKLGGEDCEHAADAIETVEKLLPKIEQIVSGGAVGRNGVINMINNVVGKRNQVIGDLLKKFAKKMDKIGNIPLAIIFETASMNLQEAIMNNAGVNKVANWIGDGIDYVESALTLLDSMTGGLIPALESATNVVRSLNAASDTLLSRKKTNDTKNLIISKILSNLYKMKNSKNEFAYETVANVCQVLQEAKRPENLTTTTEKPSETNTENSATSN